MGYTTEFVGQFDCYHVENPQIGAFLKSVYNGERSSMAGLADWLTERGDPRGAKIAEIMSKTPRDMTQFWRLFPLKPRHAAYLNAFSNTRRMTRDPARAMRLPDPVREAVEL